MPEDETIKVTTVNNNIINLPKGNHTLTVETAEQEDYAGHYKITVDLHTH